MPAVKISELPAASPLADGDVMPLVQAGATVRATVTQLGAAALAGLPGPNAVVNGGCLVSQRAARALGTAMAYGEVDCIAVGATGTVTGGTVARTEGVFGGLAGYACSARQASLSGTGDSIAFRVRIEARDARAFVGRAGAFSCRVRHDVGSAVDFTVTASKADAADDFAAVTTVGQSTPVAVASDSDVRLELALADFGDCGHGIEIAVTAACGAIAGKTISAAHWKLEPGQRVTPFAPRPVGLETALVRRYLQRISAAGGRANSASNVQMSLSHPGMRTAPGYAATAALTVTDMVTADFTQSAPQIGTVHDGSPDGGRVDLGLFSGLSAGTQVVLTGAGGAILASAEL
jgi:hypothetical protein